MKHTLTYLGICTASLIILAGCDAGGGFDDSPTIIEGSDPVIEDFPIVYVERPIPRNDDEDDPEQNIRENDVLDPTAFNPGARLIFRPRAANDAPETIISDAAFLPEDFDPEVDEPPLYDVKDIAVSDDASRIAFAMRAPEDPDAAEEDQPTWNIWTYDFDTEELNRVIESDVTAEGGQDIAPAFLPNGDIVFTSTRQRRSRAILLNEGKPQFSALTEEGDDESLLLHTIDEDGLDIAQITFNQSHDLQPTVLQNGQIMFLRWDNFGEDRLSLYTVNRDGSDLTLQYGFHSPNTGTNDSEGVFNQAIEMDDGRILVTLRPRSTDTLGGDLVAIDKVNFIDRDQPIFDNRGATEQGQQSIAINPVISDGSAASPHGFFSSAYPLFDPTGRLIVSWTPCLIQGVRFGAFVNEDGLLVNDRGEFVDANANTLPEGATAMAADPDAITAFPCTDATLALGNIEIADPQFGLWIYDPIQRVQAPILLPEPGMMYTEAVVINAINEPDFFELPNDPETLNLVEENLGVINIKSIYDFAGVDTIGIAPLADPAITPVRNRPAHFVRFYKPVSLPDDDLFDLDTGLARGEANAARGFRDILGYAPVQPDGSVKVRVPSDVALSFEILDINGRRLAGQFSGSLGQEHRNWLTVRAGETKTCNGCHVSDSLLPHGRVDAEPPAANLGAFGGIPFTNTRLMNALGEDFPPPDSGQTMAEYFYAQNLQAFLAAPITTRDPAPLSLSVDIVFEDVWTDESNGLVKEPSFAYRYGSPDFQGNKAADELQTLEPVTLTSCLDVWDNLCRTIINYDQHIQPLFDFPRMVDINDVPTDVTCVNCHAEVDPDGNPMVPEPINGSQLVLTQDIAVDEADGALLDYPNSYIYLFGNGRRIREQCVAENKLIFEQREANVEDQTLIITNLLNAQNSIEMPLVAGEERFLFLQELLEINGVPQFVQEQLIVDGIPQFQALDADSNIVAAPLDTPLTLIRDANDDPIVFLVNARHRGAPVAITYAAQTACESIGGDRVDPAALETSTQLATLVLNEGDEIPILAFRLDANGIRIPHTVPTDDRNRALFSNNGANASAGFFNVFETNGAHEGYLNGVELKLISEWLDIGGQFYNNPFETLEDD